MGIIPAYAPDINDLRDKISAYRPCNLQEAKDKDIMMHCIKTYPDILFRSNELAHFTASSWIVNRHKSKVLMVFHNIYNSWSWTGGHADGDADLCTVALREAYEESGVFIPGYNDEIFSIESLTVPGHMKNGGWVSSHLHLNVTFLFEADDTLPLTPNPNENSGVKWVPINEAVEISTEPEMKVVYEKLNKKVFGQSFFNL